MLKEIYANFPLVVIMLVVSLFIIAGIQSLLDFQENYLPKEKTEIRHRINQPDPELSPSFIFFDLNMSCRKSVDSCTVEDVLIKDVEIYTGDFYSVGSSRPQPIIERYETDEYKYTYENFDFQLSETFLSDWGYGNKYNYCILWKLPRFEVVKETRLNNELIDSETTECMFATAFEEFVWDYEWAEYYRLNGGYDLREAPEELRTDNINYIEETIKKRILYNCFIG